jgi:hypothetical protein
VILTHRDVEAPAGFSSFGMLTFASKDHVEWFDADSKEQAAEMNEGRAGSPRPRTAVLRRRPEATRWPPLGCWTGLQAAAARRRVRPCHQLPEFGRSRQALSISLNEMRSMIFSKYHCQGDACAKPKSPRTAPLSLVHGETGNNRAYEENRTPTDYVGDRDRPAYLAHGHFTPVPGRRPGAEPT